MKTNKSSASRADQRTVRGFTLIEMLIVIAVIGILASAVLVGLGPVQRQGRDSRRIADLRQVQNALELYYNKCGHYPGDATCGSTIPGDDWNAMTTALTGASIGIKSIPFDPSTGKSYHYATDLKTYVIGAELEDANNPNLRQSATSSLSITATFCSAANTNPFCIEF